MTVPYNQSVLEDEGLREIDRIILDFLQEGRVTPVYLRERIIAEGVRDSITEQYCQQRLKRLVEHDHVENLLSVGLYQLSTDPRECDNDN